MIELVGVLAIIVVMLSIALGSFYGWTRASGIHAAASLAASVLGQAREMAITQGVETKTRVKCFNFTPAGRSPCGMITVYTMGAFTNTAEILAMPSNTLPAGVCFRIPDEQILEFGADGTCRATAAVISNGCVLLMLDSISGEAARRLTRVIEVNPLSGRIRVRREEEP